MDNFWTDEKVAEFFKEHWIRCFLKRAGGKSDIEFIKDYREQSTSPSKEWEILNRSIYNEEFGWSIHTPNNKCIEDHICKIHSVKRLSDNEVFTIGDSICLRLYPAFDVVQPISKIEIENGKLFLYYGESSNYELSFARKNSNHLRNKETNHTKPPIGLMPMFIHNEQRLTEINDAISRYALSNLPIPKEWLNERETLISWTKSNLYNNDTNG